MKKRLRKALETLALELAEKAVCLNDGCMVEDGEDRAWIMEAAKLGVAAAKIAEVLESSPKCVATTLEPGEPLEGVTCYGTTINGDKFAF